MSATLKKSATNTRSADPSKKLHKPSVFVPPPPPPPPPSPPPSPLVNKQRNRKRLKNENIYSTSNPQPHLYHHRHRHRHRHLRHPVPTARECRHHRRRRARGTHIDDVISAYANTSAWLNNGGRSRGACFCCRGGNEGLP